jgi:hypothetical protein
MSEAALADAKNSPTAWFAVLERAKLTGDQAMERRALAQLGRLGVSVRFDTAADPAQRNPEREMSPA